MGLGLSLADQLSELGREPIAEMPVFGAASSVPGNLRFLPAPERLLRLGEIVAQGWLSTIP